MATTPFLKNVSKPLLSMSSQVLKRNSSSWMESLSSLLGPKVPKVRQIGDPILREVAVPVDQLSLHTAEFKKLLQVMVETMRAANAVGLAAPQIGVGLQVFVMEYTKGHMETLKKRGFTLDDFRRMQMDIVPLKTFINPEVKVTNSKMVAFKEGCLSVEGFSGVVPRAVEVEVSGLNENGEPVSWKASGWAARIVQHEVDHLRGNIYVDSMVYKSFMNNNWNDFVE